MKKAIKKIAFSYTPDFPGLRAVNIMGSDFPIEPFLVFTEFRMNRPVFGPHPHAGISVMTYLLPDSEIGFINRDSNGDHSRIEPGGLHITQAGRGIHHDEFPETKGAEAHGFQIWFNHAEKDRLAVPKAMHAAADQLPEVQTDDYKVRILHGKFQGQSPAHQMLTDVTLLHIFLNAGKRIVLEAAEMAFVYSLQGGGNSGVMSFSAQTLLNFSAEGDSVEIVADENGLEFMFGTGRPLREPIVYGGPFVMTTPEQMADTRRRLGRGEMGTLPPYEKH
jgi:quercetin 2,3-dioxygenase